MLPIVDLLMHGLMTRLGPAVDERLRKVKDSVEYAHEQKRWRRVR